jgi:hypothetical protein
MTNCRSCGAEIIWAKTIKNRAIPLDAEPNPTGNVVLSDEGTALVYNSPEAIAPRYESYPRYLSHFATCPDHEQWRK